MEARGFGASEEPAGVGLAITTVINHLIHESYPGWLIYRGDEILPNDRGIISYTIIGIPINQPGFNGKEQGFPFSWLKMG